MTSKIPLITVIGSINMDMVTSTLRVPKQGETVMGKGFRTTPGGKGANQAVAAARLGADVQMIGLVGDDSFGTELLTHLKAENINVSGVEPITNQHTGIATIIISEGDNRIIVSPGANLDVTPNYIKRYASLIDESDMVIIQLEIPIDSVEYAIRYCTNKGIPIILNPAPANGLSEKTFEAVTFMTPNETEKEEMGVEEADYPEKLIVTLGEKGVSYVTKEQKKVVVPGFKADVVDTTGAGDTFNGALAVGLGRNMELRSAIQYANAAAALSVQKFGAQGGMPTYNEVRSFLQKKDIEL